MKLAFVVSAIELEEPHYTTTLLAQEAHRAGHDILYVEVGGFSEGAAGLQEVLGRAVPRRAPKSPEKWVELIQKTPASIRAPVTELDAILIRNEPGADADLRPWAAASVLMFTQRAKQAGVLVLNDPDGLIRAASKLYCKSLPEWILPRTLISRDLSEIRAFIAELGTDAVIKPVQGSRGRNVFHIPAGDRRNLPPIVEAVGKDGYVVVQEFVSAAAQGDLRLLILDGQPLSWRGRHAAIRRVRGNEAIRSNLSAGGKAERARVDLAALRIAEAIRPALLADGLFLVGLDIAGDKLIEVNVGAFAFVLDIGEDGDVHPDVASTRCKGRAVRGSGSVSGQIRPPRRLLCDEEEIGPR